MTGNQSNVMNAVGDLVLRECDTNMCGVPLFWYPLRVTYSREMSASEELTRLGIENFLPMKSILCNADSKHPKYRLVPAINNLLFARSTREIIAELKQTNRVLAPLRFMIDHTAPLNQIMTVPDRQMENFMRVASVTDDRVVYLNDMQWVGKEGRRVRIIGGEFEGTEGVIRRVKRNKCVCVGIKGIVAVAIAFVPGILLEEIDGKHLL